MDAKFTIGSCRKPFLRYAENEKQTNKKISWVHGRHKLHYQPPSHLHRPAAERWRHSIRHQAHHIHWEYCKLECLLSPHPQHFYSCWLCFFFVPSIYTSPANIVPPSLMLVIVFMMRLWCVFAVIIVLSFSFCLAYHCRRTGI